MNHRHTLNGLTPRTIADATRDPHDWIDRKLRSNVLQFVGHMRPDAMDRLEQRKTEHVRGRYDSAMRSLRPIRRPSVIPLDSSLLARACRAWKWLCINFRSPL